jgi:uncharacterized RDD family membrane protein YckC
MDLSRGGAKLALVQCPRCKSSVPDDSEACPRCGAPLRLRPEPAPAPLDRDLGLDRRVDRAGRPIATPRAWPKAEPAPPREALAEPPSSPADRGRAGPFRATPRQWTLEEPAGPGGRDAAAAPGPGPAAKGEGGAGDFEILGPIDGDTAPGPPPAGPRGTSAPVPREGAAPLAGSRPLPRPEQAPLPFPPEVHLRRAPAWRRLLSWGVDGSLAAALSWLLVAGGARLAGSAEPEVALLPAAALLAGLLHFAHAALAQGLAGRTLGKWMAGLLLVGPDGRRPGPGRAAARALLALLSVALLGLGLLLAFFDRKGRTLHDLATGTAVVRAP